MGFYIYAEIILNDSLPKDTSEKITGHAINLVSYDDDKRRYVIDNSWKQTNEYVTDLTSFTLKRKEFKLLRLLFILPTYINTVSYNTHTEEHYTTSEQMRALITWIGIFGGDIYRGPPVKTTQPSVYEPIREPITESLPRKCWNGICSWMGKTQKVEGGIKRKLRKTRKYRLK